MIVPLENWELYGDNRTWDWSILKPGETFWIGPVPVALRDRELNAALGRARYLTRQGLPIFVKLTEQYLCVRHLTEGKPKKLSEWYSLAVGESIMLNPAASASEVELARGTCGYLRFHKKLTFEVDILESGELWIVRLS